MARSAILSAVHASWMGKKLLQEQGLRHGSVNLEKRTMNGTKECEEILLKTEYLQKLNHIYIDFSGWQLCGKGQSICDYVGLAKLIGTARQCCKGQLPDQTWNNPKTVYVQPFHKKF
jgi:hypothetical protein